MENGIITSALFSIHADSYSL